MFCLFWMIKRSRSTVFLGGGNMLTRASRKRSLTRWENPSYQNLAPIKNLLNKQGRSEDVNLSEEEEIDDE